MTTHYINHNNPGAHTDLVSFLIHQGIVDQNSATGVADMIMRDHIRVFRGATFIHLGTL